MPACAWENSTARATTIDNTRFEIEGRADRPPDRPQRLELRQCLAAAPSACRGTSPGSAPSRRSRRGPASGIATATLPALRPVHRDRQTPQRQRRSSASTSKVSRAPSTTAAATTNCESRVAVSASATTRSTCGDRVRRSVPVTIDASSWSAARLCCRACANSELPITRRSSVYSSTAFSADLLVLRELRCGLRRSAAGSMAPACRDAAPFAPGRPLPSAPPSSAG